MHIELMTRAHLPETADVASKAFGSGDELFAYLHPHRFTYPSHFHGHFVHSLRAVLNGVGRVAKVCVADDGDEWYQGGKVKEGTVLGFACWTRKSRDMKRLDGRWARDTVRKKVERALASVESFYSSHLDPDLSVDEDHLQNYNNVMSAHQTDFNSLGDEYIHLEFLAVDPDYQGKGVGKRLMQWGLAAARSERIPIGLRSSPRGEALYKSVGFRDVDTLVFNGVEEVDKVYVWGPEGADRSVV